MRVGGGLPLKVATSRAAAREGVTWEVAQQWKCKRPKFGRTSSGGSSALTDATCLSICPSNLSGGTSRQHGGAHGTRS